MSEAIRHLIKKCSQAMITLHEFQTIEINNWFEVADFFPILFDGKPLKFMNGSSITCGSSGDDYIPVSYEGVLRWIKIGWEPDCDGSYYWSYMQSNESIAELCELPDNSLEINNNWYVQPAELYKYFAHHYQNRD